MAKLLTTDFLIGEHVKTLKKAAPIKLSFSVPSSENRLRKNLSSGKFKIINYEPSEDVQTTQKQDIEFKKKLLVKLNKVQIGSNTSSGEDGGKKSWLSQGIQLITTLISGMTIVTKLKNVFRVMKRFTSLTGIKRLLISKYSGQIRFFKNFKNGGIIKAITNSKWYKIKYLRKVEAIKNVYKYTKMAATNPKALLSLGKDVFKGNVVRKIEAAKDGIKVVSKIPSKLFGKASAAAIATKAGAKTGGKIAGKLIPFVGGVIAMGFAIQRAREGDYMGAAIEGLAGAVEFIPGVGQVLGPVLSIGLPLAYDGITKFFGVSKETTNKMLKNALTYNPITAPAMMALKLYNSEWFKKTMTLDNAKKAYNKMKTVAKWIWKYNPYVMMFKGTQKLIKGVSEMFTKTKKTLKDLYESTKTKIGDFFSSLWDKLKGVLGSAWNGIKNFFGFGDNSSSSTGIKLSSYNDFLTGNFANGNASGHVSKMTALANKLKGTKFDFRTLTGEAESGGEVGKISGGVGDAGGKSYGKYQIASKVGSLKAFVDASNIPELKKFRGMKEKEFLEMINTPGNEFDKAFTSLAKKNPKVLDKEQERFSDRLFKPFLDTVESDRKNLSDPAKAVLYRISNQFGPGGAKNIYRDAKIYLKTIGKDIKTVPEVEMITAIQSIRASKLFNQYGNNDQQRGVLPAVEGEQAFYLTAIGAEQQAPIQQAEITPVAEVPTSVPKKMTRDDRDEIMKTLKMFETGLSKSQKTVVASKQFNGKKVVTF